jgi:Fe2+ or Zn2+ uptake regulation protein
MIYCNKNLASIVQEIGYVFIVIHPHCHFRPRVIPKHGGMRFLSLCYNLTNMKEQELFLKVLRDNGYSKTRTRTYIFDLLLNTEPQSMHMLIDASKGKVDRVSIYRTIALFEQLDIVQRINVGWKYKIELSSTFLAHHHHMTCLSCGCVITIQNNEAFEDIIQALSQANEFTLTYHQLEIQGYCSNCKTGNP